MAGVTISTAVRTGAINVGTAPAATFFLLGTSERGQHDQATLITSLEDFETKFGEHVTGSYSWYSMKTFFEEGGVRAYFVRVTASAGVKGTKAILSATGSAAGVTFTAVGKGVYANSLIFTVTNNTTSFDVLINYGSEIVFDGSGYTSITAMALMELSQSRMLFRL